MSIALAPDQNNTGQFIETGVFNYSALANALDPSGLAAARLSTFVKFLI